MAVAGLQPPPKEKQMISTIIARSRPDSQQIVAQHAAPVIELEERAYSNHKRAVGDVFKLHARTWNRGPTEVYADPEDHLQHLDGRATGFQWGDDDDNSLGLRFTYLGLYEYVSATVSQTTLAVTVRYRRIVQEATA